MRTTPRRQRGITFVDSAVCLAVVSVLLGSGLPTLLETRQAERLEAAVAELRTDVQHARSAAVSMAQPVRLRVMTAPQGSCTVMHVGATGSCSCTPAGGSTCTGDGRVLKSSHFPIGGGVTLSANASTLTFAGEYGTVTPTGSITATGARQGEVKLVVNVTGRSRTCRLSGPATGHPPC